MKCTVTLCMLIGLVSVQVQAFVTTQSSTRGLSTPFTRKPTTPSTSTTASTPSHVLYAAKTGEEPSFLLQEFRTADGEILNPYKVLKVYREATRQEIKQAYRDLSRRYHPDGVRHRDILPGSCNNLDDVRDHWERIKLSYEILSDTKMRKRFNRHEAIAGPGQAMQRAAMGGCLLLFSLISSSLVALASAANNSLETLWRIQRVSGYGDRQLEIL
jgi:hypothetical protein